MPDQDSTNGENLREPEPEPTVDPLQQLRNLVVGSTASEVKELRQEIENKRLDAQEVSEVLPDAIRRSAADGKKLANALGPTLSQAFEQSVRRDPQGLADAISPIMGPAIRRSITQQIRTMIQSLNTTLEHSLSPQSFKWRLEAWRTGKPFAEVLLLHTLVYRVEQLLLIDPQTGLLMQNVAAVEDGNADLVSSLLTAIQDFMRESFQPRSVSGSELQTMHSSELTVWIQHGPSAILAAAVRGEPPIELRDDLQAALERIHVDHAALLRNFQGDTEPLELVRPELEELLGSEFVKQHKKEQEPEPPSDPNRSKYLRWAIPTLLLLLALAWGLTIQRNRERQRLATEVTESLRETPGIAIISVTPQGSKFIIHGLRDPLSAAPDDLIRAAGIHVDDTVQYWEPYRCLDKRLAMKRLQYQLDQLQLRLPTATMQLVPVDDTTGGIALVVTGEAPASWLQKLQYVARLTDVATTIDISQLTVTEDPD